MGTGREHCEVPARTADETERTELFRAAWRIYQLIVDADSNGHEHAGKLLGRMLDSCDIGSRRFIDLACGDAGTTTKILCENRPRAYLGVDLSEDALVHARENLQELAALGVPIETTVADFTATDEIFAGDDGGPAFGWIGLSIHHLEHERTVSVLRALREHIDGPLGLWEPMLLPGDSHEDWVQRWFAFASARFGDRASQADRGLMLDHVRTADLTRTIDTWESEAREAGWEKFEFLDSTADQTLGIMLLQ